jgi:predicted lipoprotein
MRHRLFTLFCTAALSTTLISCESDVSTTTSDFRDDVDTSTAVTEIIDLTVIPATEDFLQQAQQLSSLSDSFCTPSATEDKLTALQTQWQTTTEAWYHLLPYNFGPMINDEVSPEYIFIDSLRERGSDYTSTVRNDISTMLDSTDDLTESVFSNKTNTLLGLLPLEIVLFEQSETQSNSNSDIVAEFTAEPRKCDILSGYANQLLSRAENIESGWNTAYKTSGESYRNLLLNGGLEDLDNEDGKSAINKLIVATQEVLDYSKRREIANKAGVLSGHTWTLMLSLINSVETLIEGDEQATESFADLIAQNYPSYLITIRSNIAQAKQNITDQDADAFHATAGQLDGNIKRELSEGLEITLGTNFSDGD